MLVVAASTLANSAHAMDGNELYGLCRSSASLEQGMCLGYAVASYGALMDDPKYNGAQICPPAKIARGQIRDVVLKRMQDHPEERHLSARVVIFRALKNAWPCAGPWPAEAQRQR